MIGIKRALRRGGAVAGPLFVGVFLIEGACRPGYRPLRHPVSSLALGPRGWVQTANFAATGMLYLAGAVGLARSSNLTGRSRIAAAALGATGIGLPIFLGIPAAATASAWQAVRVGRPGWAAYSAATAAAMVTCMRLAGQGFAQAPRFVSYAGLLQRAAIVTGFSWLTAASARPPQ